MKPNYKHLLIRYLQHIHREEGHDFLPKENPCTLMSDEEHVALQNISQHAESGVYECTSCHDTVDIDTGVHIPKEDWPGPWKTVARVCGDCRKWLDCESKA